MIDRTALILLDAKSNRHSINALLGALDTDPGLDDLEVRMAADEHRLREHLTAAAVAGKRPIVGVSFATSQLWPVRDMMRRLVGQSFQPGDAGGAFQPGVSRTGVRLKSLTCKPLWIAGGPHPTADVQGTLRLGFDVVVLGEGEATFLDLLRVVIDRGDLAAVRGVAIGGAGCEPQWTERRTPIDLDAFPPFPSRRRRRIGPIEITRGCPFACAYCQTSHLLGTLPRHRSIEAIARHTRVIAQRNPCDVRVVTPNAFSYGSPDGRTLNLPALESLLAALRQSLGPNGRLFFGTFPSEVRPEHVHEATVGLVKRYASNDSLVIGAQSGSQRVLDRCGRGHGVAEVFDAVACTLAAGLRPLVDFIFGLPGETPDDLQETIRVIRELAAMGAWVHAHTFMALPQTRFASEPPGRIPGRLRPVIKELIRGGRLFGAWPRQEREARRISQYVRSGEWQ